MRPLRSQTTEPESPGREKKPSSREEMVYARHIWVSFGRVVIVIVVVVVVVRRNTLTNSLLAPPRQASAVPSLCLRAGWPLHEVPGRVGFFISSTGMVPFKRKRPSDGGYYLAGHRGRQPRYSGASSLEGRDFRYRPSWPGCRDGFRKRPGSSWIKA